MTEHAVYRPRSFVVAVMVVSVLWSVLEALAQTPELKVASIDIREPNESKCRRLLVDSR